VNTIFFSGRSRLCSQAPSFESAKEGAHGLEHQPVLLNEVIEQLKVRENGIYVDATFGCGGHTQRIIEKLGSNGILLCIDKDQDAIAVGKKQFFKDKRVIFKQGSFNNIKQWTDELGFAGRVSGILMDLGVSSPQVDTASRGFSFLRDGPLDMRMDLTQSLTAAKWLNKAKENDIAWVLKKYGEERFSRRIAREIVRWRAERPLRTTKDLVNIITGVMPIKDWKKHPATRTFQALRIFINNELQELSDSLEQCLDVLEITGRLVVISFHSLEDRIVKHFIQKHSGVNDIFHVFPPRLQRVGKFIKASSKELMVNPRSRSAIMRVMEKMG
jgi:16S rRNA (cytosine1402-N4)-methyltransferase